MELTQKLAILADAAKYDASCASSGSKRKNPGGLGNTEGMGICHSYTPDGRCVSLLKILLTNHCAFDCAYCVNRVSNDIPRARFSVKDVVDLTLAFYRRNYIEGLFLSSGVPRSSDEIMGEMIAVARTLRLEHKFGGYIHLKAVVGASPALLAEAGRYADRLSANVEFPSQRDLDSFAPAKSEALIETTMGTIAEKIAETREDQKRGLAAEPFAPGGQSTQMIVGATASTDTDILGRASTLYREKKLRRVYYTAFSPIPGGDPRLPLTPAPLVREHRLYQADWLVRHYEFRPDELTTAAEPNLSLERDPKLSWALRHPQFFPVDVNTAPREALLRVPGLGVRNVDRILASRKFRKLSLADLGRLRVSLKRAKYFVVAGNDRVAPRALEKADLRPVLEPLEQLSLFDAPVSARTGDL